jgi:hypothetical protein
MRPIFEAVAHRNPYPVEEFDENSWNQLVLKAVFVESKLDRIQGLDARANPRLMRMLCNFAHERWAAGRSVSPELWRCVGPHADFDAVSDLSKVLNTGSDLERKAAALALAASPGPIGHAKLETAPRLATAVRARQFTWSDIAGD